MYNNIQKLSDGALNEWIGYAPVLSDNPDFKKNKEDNIKYQGYGQMGIIMLDIQWNAKEEGNGLAELAKTMYDKKMWDDDGALIQSPSFRTVADIVLVVFPALLLFILKLYIKPTEQE